MWKSFKCSKQILIPFIRVTISYPQCTASITNPRIKIHTLQVLCHNPPSLSCYTPDSSLSALPDPWTTFQPQHALDFSWFSLVQPQCPMSPLSATLSLLWLAGITSHISSDSCKVTAGTALQAVQLLELIFCFHLHLTKHLVGISESQSSASYQSVLKSTFQS